MTADIRIPQEIIDKWQGIVDLIAEIVQVPAALIRKLEPPEVTVFVSSHSPGNPYGRGEKASLNTVQGTYTYKTGALSRGCNGALPA